MTPSVLIAVTHLLGAGHLTRAAAIGRGLARAGHRVTLATGGMPAALVDTSGMEVVQLPPIRAASQDFRALLGPDGSPVGADHMARRLDRLEAAYRGARPDILVTELYPFGRRILAGEFGQLIEVAHAAAPRPLLACSIRDILVAPTKPGRLDEAHAILAARYDAILVHGDPRLVPLDASWPLASDLAGRLHETGYIDADPPAEGITGDPVDILVSGGSSAAAIPLYEAVIGAAALLPERRWHILVGHAVPDDGYRALVAAAPRTVRVERARPDFRAILGRARLFVGLAGYNTAVDLLATGTPAILVPFERGRETEQRLRAERLAATGRAVLLPEATLSADTLAGAVPAARALPDGPPEPVDLDGVAGTVRVLNALWRERRRASPGTGPAAPNPVRPRLPSGLARVVRADLDRLADTGRTLSLWWRDDDATAATPALDRLLALSQDLGIPVAIAAVPDAADASLAERLRDAPGIRALVHGFAHQNHEAPSRKRSEFGASRDLQDVRSDAASALTTARRLFGSRLLPVFVPPWNRILPDHAAALPALGYRGLSCFGGATRTESRVARVDTHLDPVDWHGGGGLAGEDRLLEQWRSALRVCDADGTSPRTVGLLSHHLATKEPVWAFVTAMLELLTSHPAVRTATLANLWPAGPNRASDDRVPAPRTGKGMAA